VLVAESLTVPSTLPPFCAARSTITEPRRILATVSALTSVGAGRFGISAVVMTMSASATASVSIACSAALYPSLISFAYPPPPSPSSSYSTLRKLPPSDSTCSRTTGRTSYAETSAPRFLAVCTAARPATPQPSTSTLAGGTLPAAVIWPAKKRPKACEASTTAR